MASTRSTTPGCLCRMSRPLPESEFAALSDRLRADVPVPGGLSEDARSLFVWGAEAAPLVAGVVLRASEEATARHARVVSYFTREGTFFRRVHEAWRNLGGHAVPSDILEVSRLSTFAASLREVTPTEMRRVWNLFRSQSVGALLATLGCPSEGLEGIVRRVGLQLDEPVRDPWNDQRVAALFTTAEFSAGLTAHRDRRRRELLGYLRAHGVRDDAAPRVIVDIGWRGTIQDNLAWLMPGTHFTGVYLAMHIVLNAQPPNVAKIAYAADVAAAYERCARLLQHVQPLEMVCNSPEGSVVGYRRSGLLRRWTAVRAPHGEDAASFDTCARHFQDGVVAALPVLARLAPDARWTSDVLRPHAFASLQRLIADPPPAAARAFFSLRHHETFGVGTTVDMSRSIAPGERFTAPSTQAEREALETRADQSCWPCAFYRLHGLEAEREWFAVERLMVRRAR